jgi:P27 family predicted phage terminase small subunit
MTGRIPKPVEVKRRLGNPGKRALPAAAVALKPSVGVPSLPATLGTHGRAAWNRLWAAGQNWLSPVTDIDVLTRLCEAHDERAHLKGVLDEDGPFATSQKGAAVSHPAVAQLRALEALMTTWESLCGFTPADRGRLGSAEVKTADTLDRILSRRRAGR